MSATGGGENVIRRLVEDSGVHWTFLGAELGTEKD